MPTIFREDGFQIRIYPNDHDPAHVHAIKSNGEAKIQIKDENGNPQIIESWNMDKKNVAKALEIVKNNQSNFLVKWWDIHDPFK